MTTNVLTAALKINRFESADSLVSLNSPLVSSVGVGHMGRPLVTGNRNGDGQRIIKASPVSKGGGDPQLLTMVGLCARDVGNATHQRREYVSLSAISNT